MDRGKPNKPSRVVAKTYRDLVAWQVSMELVAEIYRLAARLPSIERYGLASQLRRAAVSIPLNIAEGFGRQSHREFSRFLVIALASLREVQTLIELVAMLGYESDEALSSPTNLADRTGFLVHRLRKSVAAP
jgi:four helix bundle protein